MMACKTLTLVQISTFSLKTSKLFNSSHFRSISALNFSNCNFSSLIPSKTGIREVESRKSLIRRYNSVSAAVSLETHNYIDEISTSDPTLEPLETSSSKDTVAELLTNKDDVTNLMKMERKTESTNGRWFPYVDKFRVEGEVLSSSEVLEALDPYMMEVRKERFKNAVMNRSYSVCLVVEGLRDFGNASAAFRSADALGFQSVHVISRDSSKRCSIV